MPWPQFVLSPACAENIKIYLSPLHSHYILQPSGFIINSSDESLIGTTETLTLLAIQDDQSLFFQIEVTFGCGPGLGLYPDFADAFNDDPFIEYEVGTLKQTFDYPPFVVIPSCATEDFSYSI